MNSKLRHYTLVIVPTRELTIQTVMLTYKLFGGSLNVGVPGDPGNMFNYFGPQGVKVAGVFEWDHEEREGLADVAEIVVGTPEHLVRMKASGRLEARPGRIARFMPSTFSAHPEIPVFLPSFR